MLARGAAAVHPAAHEGAGRAGAAGADRADDLLRARAGRSASCTTSCATHYRAVAARRASRATGMQQVEDAGPRGAAAAAPGGVPPGPDRPARAPTSRRRSSTCCCRGCTELVEEGHKALVFSQFTSLLALLRDAARRGGHHLRVPRRPDARSRGARSSGSRPIRTVRLFLISLKAGGLGLNLTAAEYVFLLDPWWNPAVEAQAIDRAHRIGQTRQVFAYRLIARDTVEEKVARAAADQARPGRRHRPRRRQPDSRPEARGSRAAAVVSRALAQAKVPVSQTRLTAPHDEREAHDDHEEDSSKRVFASVVSFEIFVMVS